MASVAQLVQAPVGAMMGAGIARGNGTMEWKAILNIVKGWIIAPISGITIAFIPAKITGIWLAL